MPVMRKKKVLSSNHLKDVRDVAQEIISYAGEQKIWLFEGEMGIGKTTLIKAVCAELGVEDNVTSPTFSLVNEYETQAGDYVYHFDFYRINNENEAWAIGCETYFYSGCYCFIEWPTKIATLIPEKHLEIMITHNTATSRNLQLKLYG
ncbi:MAG: tRNA (adenosine(37)-N6)-threonylcarbamoyltransferase complex ATPase subunit type 1 TsaE [Cytophagales bacterium]|nr:tRNA (adenosine(37)-N6)-threonylcarbamoyltransferase complex ATPase subunit type 1 TsaE [Cytophagales bacterium]